MRIALLTAMLSPAAGGLAVSVPGMARHLRSLGADAQILGTIDPAHPDGPASWGAVVHAHPVRGPLAFRYAPGLFDTLARLNPDIVDVHGLWNYPSLASLRYARRTGRRYVVTPRGMLDRWSRERARFKKKLVRIWFEDAHLRNAACIRATAEMEAEHIRSFGLRQPVAIIPNAIDMPGPAAAAPAAGRPKRILLLSRLHQKKGIDYLLRAWAAVARDLPGWEIAIAGLDENGHEAEMKALAARLGLPRVAWLGPVYGERKSDLYRSADLFVLPTHAENFGLVVAEALAHGVPVVTTRHAPWQGLEENRCGWWIDLTDEALVDALRRATALADGERSEMGARGRAWMERSFGWDSVATRVLEVYEWVAQDARRPDCVID